MPDQRAIVVADLDARRDWLELFPFLATRRPDPTPFVFVMRRDGTSTNL
ncbi:hypothetical protein ABT126_44765 [Streptomyces sp. NPDC002012]|nr:hypothetical protein OG609_44235 [Streptomyces sp. NBC_01224]